MKRVRTILSVILSVTLFLQFSLPCFADVKNEIQAASSRSFVDDCGFFGAEKHLADSSVPPVPTSPDALLGEDTARLIAFASGASTTGIINNAVNAIYYNNFSSENSDLEQDPNKSDYVDEGYISRWRRLDYTKTITHQETYNLNAWRFYSEYSAYMYVWFVSGWADEKSIPLFSKAAGRAYKADLDDVHLDDDKNVRALTIVFGGLGL